MKMDVPNKHATMLVIRISMGTDVHERNVRCLVLILVQHYYKMHFSSVSLIELSDKLCFSWVCHTRNTSTISVIVQT